MDGASDRQSNGGRGSSSRRDDEWFLSIAACWSGHREQSTQLQLLAQTAAHPSARCVRASDPPSPRVTLVSLAPRACPLVCPPSLRGLPSSSAAGGVCPDERARLRCGLDPTTSVESTNRRDSMRAAGHTERHMRPHSPCQYRSQGGRGRTRSPVDSLRHFWSVLTRIGWPEESAGAGPQETGTTA